MAARKQTKVMEKKLKRNKAVGIAYASDNLVYVDLRQTDYNVLDTLIHEKMHIQFTGFSEKLILKLSRDMAKYLWGLGYRRVHATGIIELPIKKKKPSKKPKKK